jgi:glycosyltransferase involved in cell wall biosynthesis
MRVSVVIRSKDEADRLRLTLASLLGQTGLAEVIVVDDGSSDHTDQVIAEAAAQLPLRAIRHAAPRGRSAASNAGAAAAQGDVLLFLDGDTLAGPDLVARHAEAHEAADDLVARGETFHLRCTRLFRDPAAGTPRPEEAARVARMPAGELAGLLVTRSQIAGDFAAIERRAQPGIYPGAGPRRLYDLEMEALHNHPDCGVLWAAASGANASVRRAAFLSCGGFNADLHNNEHRELALRMSRAGARVVAVRQARTYHMTHRAGWRDPLKDASWEEIFFAAHPLPEVRLLSVFWASLSDGNVVPPALRILSLPALEAAARDGSGYDHQAARRLCLALRAPVAA